MRQNMKQNIPLILSYEEQPLTTPQFIWVHPHMSKTVPAILLRLSSSASYARVFHGGAALIAW